MVLPVVYTGQVGGREGGGGDSKKDLYSPTLYAAGERAERECLTARGATRSGVHASEVKEQSASSARRVVARRHPQEAQGRGPACGRGRLPGGAGRAPNAGARRGHHICTSLRRGANVRDGAVQTQRVAGGLQ